LVNNPPKFGEKRVGWYKIGNYWYLTFGAAKKELEVTKKQLDELLLGVATETLTNPYNERPFMVYSLDSLRSLKKFKWKKMLV